MKLVVSLQVAAAKAAKVGIRSAQAHSAVKIIDRADILGVSEPIVADDQLTERCVPGIFRSERGGATATRWHVHD